MEFRLLLFVIFLHGTVHVDGLLTSKLNQILINEDACNGGVSYVTATAGTITSPIHRIGAQNISCFWVIKNPENNPLVLSFSKFELYEKSSCDKDCCEKQWLRIKTKQPETNETSEFGENLSANSSTSQLLFNDDHVSMYQAKLSFVSVDKIDKTVNKNKYKDYLRPEVIVNKAPDNVGMINDNLPVFAKKRKGPSKLLLDKNSTLYYLVANSKEKNVKSDEEESTKQSHLELQHFTSTGQLCGRGKPGPILTKASEVEITFHSFNNVNYSGPLDFELQFTQNISLKSCNENEFSCTHPPLCLPNDWKCNGQIECPDASDESNCATGCSGIEDHQRCDHRWDCPHGEDELGCFGCDADEWICGEGVGCYKAIHHCDDKTNCPNAADELFCGSCGANNTQCSPLSQYCYNVKTERCDGQLNCPGGEDEIGCASLCRSGISCKSGESCYSLSERCDGVTQCGDGTDEANCVPQLCHPGHGAFLCANRRCIQASWRCDQFDDCGDSSDEDDCLRNSIIVAAAMGGLVCSLLLVIAVGCTCRLYALRLGMNRTTGLRNDQSGFDYHRSFQRRHRGHLIAPLTRLQEHLLQREAPPSYNVAVNDPSTLTQNCSRHSRNWRRINRRYQVPSEHLTPQYLTSCSGLNLPPNPCQAHLPTSGRLRSEHTAAPLAVGCTFDEGKETDDCEQSNIFKHNQSSVESVHPTEDDVPLLSVEASSTRQQNIHDDDDEPLIYEDEDDDELLLDNEGYFSNSCDTLLMLDERQVHSCHDALEAEASGSISSSNYLEEGCIPDASFFSDSSANLNIPTYSSDSDEKVNETNDVIIATRAAVLALSDVQHHMDRVTESLTTEMDLQ